jgi:hypothetical protein
VVFENTGVDVVVTDATASLPRGGATVAVAEFALRTRRTW